jgi:acyl-CoA thioesterase I
MLVVKKIIILCFMFLVACGHHTSEQHLIEQGSTVVILGDSLSYGVGAEKGQDYPALLTKLTGWNIVNAGVSGDTSAQGLDRLPALLEAHHPKLLIVELGGNDLLRQAPSSQIESNIKAILSKAKANGVATVLVAIPAVSALRAAVGSLSDHPVYEKIANDTKTPLIKEVFSEVLSQRNLKFDQIHPNADGYVKVAEGMQAALKEQGFLY